jgi:hypothetical protein
MPLFMNLRWPRRLNAIKKNDAITDRKKNKTCKEKIDNTRKKEHNTNKKNHGAWVLTYFAPFLCCQLLEFVIFVLFYLTSALRKLHK